MTSGKLKFGTKAAVLTAISFSIPSMLSVYRERLGIEMTLSKKEIAEKMVLKYQTPQLKIISPYTTVFTHMFYHKDLRHFIWNMYTLTSSANYLNLGYEQTAFLFIGGGLTGLLTHIYGWRKRLTLTTEPSNNINPVSVMDSILPKELPKGLTKIIGDEDYKNASDSYSNVRTQLANKVFMICGSSAGVYAMVGAETVQIICDLFKEIFGRKDNTYYKDYDDEDEDIYVRSASRNTLCNMLTLEVNVFSRVQWLIAEILALLRSTELDRKDKILNMSHFSGFLFGVGVMTIWKLQNLLHISL